MLNKKVSIVKLNNLSVDSYKKTLDLTKNSFEFCVEELYEWQNEHLGSPVLFIAFNKGYSLTINRKCSRKNLAKAFKKLLLKYNSSSHYRNLLRGWYKRYKVKFLFEKES